MTHHRWAFRIEPQKMGLLYYRKPGANELWSLDSRMGLQRRSWGRVPRGPSSKPARL